jgi:hypothetical protein
VLVGATTAARLHTHTQTHHTQRTHHTHSTTAATTRVSSSQCSTVMFATIFYASEEVVNHLIAFSGSIGRLCRFPAAEPLPDCGRMRAFLPLLIVSLCLTYSVIVSGISSGSASAVGWLGRGRSAASRAILSLRGGAGKSKKSKKSKKTDDKGAVSKAPVETSEKQVIVASRVHTDCENQNLTRGSYCLIF